MLEPGLSSCETVFAQPIANQAAARTLIIDFMDDSACNIGRVWSESIHIEAWAVETVWTLPHERGACEASLEDRPIPMRRFGRGLIRALKK